MTDNVYWVLVANVNDGKQEALRKLASKFVAQTQSELRALAYEWSFSDDASRLHIYERYTDSEAALAHLAKVGPVLGELLALVTPVRLDCYGRVSDAFRDATKDLPMVYYTQFDGFTR